MISFLIARTRTFVTEAFIDTNVLIYLISSERDKAKIAERVVEQGGNISVQVLNELCNVARRKMNCSWNEVNEILTVVRSLLEIQPITIETHEQGLKVAEKYGFSLYDAMIVSSALLSNCTVLYSEDLQDGQLVESSLGIINPFSK